MRIGSISPINRVSNYINLYNGINPAKPSASISDGSSGSMPGETAASAENDNPSVIKNPGESTEKKTGRKSSPADCETCKNRKYQDGSDEMVSYKSPSHISAQGSASAVRAHEQEHVSNAFKKAAEKNGKVISANVSLQTAICPECGRSYVEGGETRTQIKYYNEENPYQKALKLQDEARLSGLATDNLT